MSENLPQKVKAQLTLAYAFGIIGVLSSAYVYWDNNKRNTEMMNLVRTKVDIAKYKEISITDELGNNIININKDGIYIEGDGNQTILQKSGLLVRSKDRKSYARIDLNKITMGSDDDTFFTSIAPAMLLASIKQISHYAIGGVGTVPDNGSFAIGAFSYYKELNDNGKILNGTFFSPVALNISDEKYDRVTVGVSHLVSVKTGGSETTSPSTIILFDKDGKVLYRLPAY
ncbi:hypothetical protein [Acetobacter orientalis]|uniref:hypothetical protein n=1 Tax=Acetobacter orientalis TaxID=146474 RepID=UPI00241F3127|nr:hypothetical protein [Acetobacter orientalis]